MARGSHEVVWCLGAVGLLKRHADQATYLGEVLAYQPTPSCPRGGSPVVYWAVDNLHSTREHLLAAGCIHHRGPLRIDKQRQISQLTDPFGTIIGLDGP